ncbi:MAG TPA: glutathione-disulfide reductase [Ferrovibrio sp.]|jgi:glutathione reductase (NADPH)|uniref:glutathione-disulfide reductase n=1 Tax=Ferrovibrio sp. TaxID=1917215 RepID=UPI002B4AF768|nr:glutathione-disulfide reductase [Ferrovibrio sp.]HLT79164.1 glutathione-disulfide reductase [Ferrovibrio sp.]
MSGYDFDLFVIGGGSGGVRAGRIAAGYGARVAVAEEYRYGGTCVIRGCVPKKLLVYGSEYAHAFRDAAGFGWTVPPVRFDWSAMIAAKDREIARLEKIYRGLFENAGVKTFDGRATLKDEHTVVIGDRTVTADKILIATGGHPVKPAVPGAELMITSNEAFHLKDLPKRVVIIGGGYIALEFAGIFNGFGSQVTVLYRGEQILRGFDDDIRNHLAAEIVKTGIDLRVKSDVTSVEQGDGGLIVHLTDGSTLEVDCVMAATGRSPNTNGLGLEAVGVETDRDGAVVVNAWSQTSVPNIYAVGDVTNRMNLTPVAIREGHAFADTVFGKKPRAADYEYVPAAVFSQPNVGTVGLSDTDARKKFGEIDVYRTIFRPMRATLSGSEERILMKLVVDARTDRVVGAHMVGPEAGEIIQGIAIAIKAGAKKADFDATVGIHPTAAEEFVTLREKVREPVQA